MSLNSVRIERRYCGPPNSANGGYACGRLAACIDGPAEVTLRQPPPLDTEMSVLAAADGAVELRLGDVLIAEAKPASLALAAPVAPGLEAARAAAARTFDASRHPLPACFVCGPQRKEGDGLRIHVGPVDAEDEGWQGLLAAPWTPDAGLADAQGVVRAEFVWAALDCPTAYACSSHEGMRIILLGRQALHLHRRPAAGAPCVVASRQTGHEGRKFFAESFLFDAAGDLLAECRTTWIEVSPSVQRGERP
jgi:hypothetical protein